MIALFVWDVSFGESVPPWGVLTQHPDEHCVAMYVAYSRGKQQKGQTVTTAGWRRFKRSPACGCWITSAMRQAAWAAGKMSCGNRTSKLHRTTNRNSRIATLNWVPTARRAPAAIDRYILPAGRSAANPPAAVDRWDIQTDEHPHSMLPRTELGGLVAEWLACWTQAQKGPGSNRSRDAVG